VITDKVNAEIPAPADGVMAELIAPEGTVVPVGQPICSIETAGGATDAAPQAAVQEPAAVAAPVESAEATSAAAPAAPVEPEAGAESAVAPIQEAFTETAADAPTEAPATHEATGGNGQAGGYHVTPAVRMLVREHGVDLSEITGSGSGDGSRRKTFLSTCSGAMPQVARLVPRARRPRCLFRRLPWLCRLLRHPSRRCRLRLGHLPVPPLRPPSQGPKARLLFR